MYVLVDNRMYVPSDNLMYVLVDNLMYVLVDNRMFFYSFLHCNTGAVCHQLGDLNLAVPSYLKAIELYTASDSDEREVLSSLYEKAGRATLRLSEQISGNGAYFMEHFDKRKVVLFLCPT